MGCNDCKLTVFLTDLKNEFIDLCGKKVNVCNFK